MKALKTTILLAILINLASCASGYRRASSHDWQTRSAIAQSLSHMFKPAPAPTYQYNTPPPRREPSNSNNNNPYMQQLQMQNMMYQMNNNPYGR